MKTMKLGVVLLALLLAALAMVPMVSADTNAAGGGNTTVITPVPTVNASDLTRFCGGNTCPMPVIVSSHIKKSASRTVSPASTKVDTSSFMYDDIETYLKTWNEKMQWGLSSSQIENLTRTLNNGVLVKYRSSSPYPNYLAISNNTEFCYDVGTVIGLTEGQKIAFAARSDEELVKGKMAFEQPQTGDSLNQIRSLSTKTYVDPSSQSAPYAYGNSVYVYIFTEFTTASPSPYPTGYWNTSEIENATEKADAGISDIEYQAPSQADLDASSMMYRTTINGKNDGDNISAHGLNGWMETAAYQLGYRDENSDGRQTDELARFIKLVFGADSVSLIYFTHDAYRSWAVGPDMGYADKAAVSLWGQYENTTPPRYYNSTSETYEHESLHLLGAMDEYIRFNSYCNEPSGLAVSPMNEFYTNSNHESCSGSVNSVMRTLDTSIINQSTKKFIGWGDHDTDGIIDPLDSTP